MTKQTKINSFRHEGQSYTVRNDKQIKEERDLYAWGDVETFIKDLQDKSKDLEDANLKMVEDYCDSEKLVVCGWRNMTEKEHQVYQDLLNEREELEKKMKRETYEKLKKEFES